MTVTESPALPRTASPAEATVASLAYWLPLLATWTIPAPMAALGVALAAPLCVAAVAWRPRRLFMIFHGFQSFHLIATFLLISAFAGLLEKPGAIRWAGALGSIPLDADAGFVARSAFWATAILRAGILVFLGIQSFRGRRAALPGVGSVPLPA